VFVCIEGIDASGKATQSKLLAERLGFKRFAFPAYETNFGKLIQGHLQKHWQALPAGGTGIDAFKPTADRIELLNAAVFQALQVANRLEVVPDINAAFEMGHSVVVDRYWPSGFAYGGIDGLDTDWLIKLHSSLPQPDLFILLEIDPSLSVRRRPERRDRYEKQSGLMERVAIAYQELWERMITAGKVGWHIVDGQHSIEEVYEIILRLVLP
jgi:dTMP kinase